MTQVQQHSHLETLALELKKRSKEALRVYRPLAHQLPFFQTTARESIIRGGKRSGKSLAAAAKFASAVTGLPIIGLNEKPLPRHFSRPPGPTFLAWIIGYDLRHIGEPIHRLLFEPGLFDVIWDDKLGRYRTWNPADPADKERESEKEPAEPMIPGRLIEPDSWSWYIKAESQFSFVRLKNGSQIHAYPSTARQAKQGSAVDIIWIDEDVAYAKHVKEYHDRLSDKGGSMFWSVWPHTTNNALLDMSARAEKQANLDEPFVHETVIRFSDNVFIPLKEKERAWDRMGSEEERRSRDYGEFMFELVRMYNFDHGRHCIYDLDEDIAAYGSPDPDEFWNRFWTANRAFPLSWTRFISVDPSHQRTAILFGVVPPDRVEFEDKLHHTEGMLLIEREMVLLRHSARECAKALRDAIGGLNIEAFLIDRNMGRTTAVGFGRTVKQEYTEAFEEYGIQSRLTGHSFLDGSNNTDTRRDAVRDRLKPPSGISPTLRVVRENCPHTIDEFVRFKKKVVETPEGKEVKDEAHNSRLFDCMAALEYLVSYTGLGYVDPALYHVGGSPAARRARAILKKQSDEDQGYCHLGPGVSAKL